jgi:ABC-2 type transport system ATP-binding protein
MNTTSTEIPIAITHLSKHYDALVALRDVSLSLQRQEIFGLIGLNGAGKTTLIKALLQLTSATSGEIQLFGIAGEEVRARRNLSYLPEKFQPSKYLTGYEYLALCVSYYQLKLDKNAAQEIAQALDFPIEKLSHKIASYSKGTAQKLGLIGAFLVNRPLLVLDEPMSGLDPMARIRLKQKMQSYRDAGNTLFFSSHILSDMDEICDRVAILHQGELRYLGTPQAFKQQYPEATLEASFLQAIAA